jgi:subtilisin family serine protease
MATPHVTGGAALSAAYSSLRGDALKKRILDAATPTSSLSGKTLTGGRINVSGF